MLGRRGEKSLQYGFLSRSSLVLAQFNAYRLLYGRPATVTKNNQNTPIKYTEDAHYAIVGKIISNWAVLELAMDGLIWKISNVDMQEGACITAQIPNSARRLDAIISLVGLNGGSKPLVKQFKKFAEKLRTAQIKRNRITHDPWDADVHSGHFRRFEVSAANTLQFGYKVIEYDDLVKFAEEIKSLMRDLKQLSDLTKSDIGASRQKRFEAFLATRRRSPT